MNLIIIFGLLCVLCGIWNVVTSLMLYDSLKKRGIPVSFLWLRVLAPGYAYKYKEITKAESGRSGPLFYNWIISINMALVFAVLAIILGLAGL